MQLSSTVHAHGSWFSLFSVQCKKRGQGLVWVTAGEGSSGLLHKALECTFPAKSGFFHFFVCFFIIVVVFSPPPSPSPRDYYKLPGKTTLVIEEFALIYHAQEVKVAGVCGRQ